MSTITVQRADERFFTDAGWLRSHHSFNFGHHYSPAHEGHGLLLVNNDNKLCAGIAERWLDRAGFMPTKKVESTKRVFFSDAKLAELEARAVEAELVGPALPRSSTCEQETTG